MSGSWYNGYDWAQRAKILRAIKRGEAGPGFGTAARPCGMCGDSDRPPNNWHSEDYSEPFLFAPPATFPLCNACHGRLHKRFANPNAEWELFCRHIEAGGYGREFTRMDSPASRRKMCAAIEEGQPVACQPIRERLAYTLDCRDLTLDPESLYAPWARPRPLRPRPSEAAYRDAFTAAALSDVEWGILCYHASAPKRTVTMRQIAQNVLDSSSPGAANLSYGKLARRISRRLNWSPDKRIDGSPFWTSVFAEGWQPRAEGREYELVMVPTLAALVEQIEDVG